MSAGVFFPFDIAKIWRKMVAFQIFCRFLIGFVAPTWGFPCQIRKQVSKMAHRPAECIKKVANE